jgi:NAD(P)-dependent dehydrogenase (short-subunit alcohol dehydrogenase family)
MTESIFKNGLLAGRVAFITGGSSGINKGIAQRFLELGASVVIVARDAAKLDAAKAELEQATKGQVVALSADVRDLAAMEAAAQRGVTQLGRYDIVVAGAAGNFLAAAAQMSANAFGAVIDIDLKGTFHTFRACHPHLNPRARLIAISAPQAVVPLKYQSHVCAAKAGIEALVRTLAVEWGGIDGVRANCLSPGLVGGTYGAEIFSGLAGEEALVGPQPVPRQATVGEVADAAVYLASPGGDFITGHTLAIDGGLSLVTTWGQTFGVAVEQAHALGIRRP